MSFSELKMLSEDTALDYVEEKTALRGTKHGIPVNVSDENDKYIVTFFVKIPLSLDPEVTEKINSLALTMPSNAILSQKSELNYLRVELFSRVLFQEDAVYVVEFLEEMTSYLSSLELETTEVIERVIAPEKPQKTVRKLNRKLSADRFDKRTVIGIIGALVGTIALIFLQGYAVRADGEDSLLAVKAVVFGLVASLVILFDYRLFAKKLDVGGIVFTTLFMLAFTVFGSALSNAVTVNSIITRSRMSPGIFEIMLNTPYYAAEFATMGYMVEIIICNILGLATGAGGFYIWYFRRNSVQMYESENDEK